MSCSVFGMAVFVTLSYYYLLLKGEIEDSDKVKLRLLRCRSQMLQLLTSIMTPHMACRHPHGYHLFFTLAMLWLLLRTFGYQGWTEPSTCEPWPCRSCLSSATWAGVWLPSTSMAASLMTSCKSAQRNSLSPTVLQHVVLSYCRVWCVRDLTSMAPCSQ